MSSTQVSLGQALRAFGNLAHENAQEALRPYGLRPLHYDILEIVSAWMEAPDSGRLSLARISRCLTRSSVHVSAHTGFLLSKGILRKDPAKSYVLTAKGIATLSDCRDALAGQERTWIEALGEDGTAKVAEAFIAMQQRSRWP